MAIYTHICYGLFKWTVVVVDDVVVQHYIGVHTPCTYLSILFKFFHKRENDSLCIEKRVAFTLKKKKTKKQCEREARAEYQTLCFLLKIKCLNVFEWVACCNDDRVSHFINVFESAIWLNFFLFFFSFFQFWVLFNAVFLVLVFLFSLAYFTNNNTTSVNFNFSKIKSAFVLLLLLLSLSFPMIWIRLFLSSVFIIRFFSRRERDLKKGWG